MSKVTTAAVEIQDIDEMRRREGIDDVELREEVRRLQVGDVVKLTLLTGADKWLTVAVRITSKRGTKFHGELSAAPTSAALRQLAGASVAFTQSHIHSVLRRREPSSQA